MDHAFGIARASRGVEHDEFIRGCDTAFHRGQQPGIEPLVIFEKVDVTDINGRPADLHIKARIPMKGIIVEEGRVLIARDILPESRWLTYIQTAECGGPVSDFVDLGEAYHTPILSTAVTHFDPVHLVLRFDTGPEPWDTFRDAVASHHGTITTPE